MLSIEEKSVISRKEEEISSSFLFYSFPSFNVTVLLAEKCVCGERATL